MFAVCMYTIILIAAAKGLNQTCFLYCQDFVNQSKNSAPISLQTECDCSTINLDFSSTSEHTLLMSSENENSEIYYEPLENSSQISKLDEKSFHMLNPLTKINETDINTNETFIDGSNDIFYNSDIYKSTSERFSSTAENTIDFPLYLDVDLHTQVNGDSSNLKEEIKHLFEKVRASEKDLSECINLHIYIFSKNNDNFNRSLINWGHHVKHDNLSNISSSEILTEIQNKCDQPATIIHESIYEVRERKHKALNFTQNIQDTTINHMYSKEEVQSKSEELSTNVGYRDLDRTLTNLDYNNSLETTTLFLNNIETDNIGGSEGKSHPLYASTQATLIDDEILNSTRTVLLEDFKHNKYVGEKDILIPKIITKEFSNGTISSVVDGYETIPNSDFETNNVIPPTEEKTIPFAEETDIEIFPLSNIHNTNHNQSNLIQDIKGNLFFLFDNNQIPARFIQNSEGEMQLAVDGFSLCDHITQNTENKLDFMKLLCNCIQLHNCSSSPSS